MSTTSPWTSFFPPEWKWAVFNRENDARGWPTAVLILPSIFILGGNPPSWSISLHHLASCWPGRGCGVLHLDCAVWSDVCVCVYVPSSCPSNPPRFFPSLASHPSTPATSSEARGGLAALIIPQWMWVSEWGFAFVTQQGDRQQGRDPSHPVRTRKYTHIQTKGPKGCARTHWRE